jgi:outer membrane protein assembly factor BamE (lipoprotein component of BamABCDE complex)
VRIILIIWIVFLCLSSVGCMTAAQHEASLSQEKNGNLTVGVVQKEIKEGMKQSEVLKVMGSPNIVTRDSDGTETWGYDKISTDIIESKDSGGVNILILGYRAQSGAKSISQRTLTVIIRFKKGIVDAFSYHSSSF